MGTWAGQVKSALVRAGAELKISQSPNVNFKFDKCEIEKFLTKKVIISYYNTYISAKISL